ncbi:hypothetical protein AB0876_04555 [Mycobacterium sp. NPDC049093]
MRQTSPQGDRKPLTAGTVKHIWDVNRRVFKYALQHKAITVNPCEAVDFSASRSTGDTDSFEHNPLSAGEVAALVAAVAGDPPETHTAATLPAYPVYALMVEFMAYTGVRTDENTGLEVGDLVFAPGAGPLPRCTVQVRRTKKRKGGEWVSGTHKSVRSRRGSRRNLLITWLIRTRTATAQLRRYGRAGRTAAGTARRVRGTPCR